MSTHSRLWDSIYEVVFKDLIHNKVINSIVNNIEASLLLEASEWVSNRFDFKRLALPQKY